ncbi:unnamed protein product [Gadus morhua 'NCC']
MQRVAINPSGNEEGTFEAHAGETVGLSGATGTGTDPSSVCVWRMGVRGPPRWALGEGDRGTEGPFMLAPDRRTSSLECVVWQRRPAQTHGKRPTRNKGFNF